MKLFLNTLVILVYFVSLTSCECSREKENEDLDVEAFVLTTENPFLTVTAEPFVLTTEEAVQEEEHLEEHVEEHTVEEKEVEEKEVEEKEVEDIAEDTVAPEVVPIEETPAPPCHKENIDVALQAADEAEAAANAQQEAGHAAAFRVQEDLAEKAANAAQAAKADLNGKEELLKQIQHELKIAKATESEARLDLADFQQTVQSSKAAARMAQQEAQLVESAMRKAQSQVADAQKVVQDVERMLRDKENLVQGMCSNEKNEQLIEIQGLRDTVVSARKTVDDAVDEAKLLESALELARKEVVASRDVHDGNVEQLNDKEQTVESARKRVICLLKKLNAANLELEDTKLAADNAQDAASKAEANIGRVKRRIKDLRMESNIGRVRRRRRRKRKRSRAMTT